MHATVPVVAKDRDLITRERIRAWVRNLEKKYKRHYPTQEALAGRIGIKQGSLNQILSGTKPSIGLDLIIKLHRRLGADLNDLIDHDPPVMHTAEDGPPGNPSEASRAIASPRRRKRHGGS